MEREGWSVERDGWSVEGEGLMLYPPRSTLHPSPSTLHDPSSDILVSNPALESKIFRRRRRGAADSAGVTAAASGAASVTGSLAFLAFGSSDFDLGVFFASAILIKPSQLLRPYF